ncbi:MAG TPA: hypothetical protein VFB80_04025 [Pirellulaceae bacterium]|nr:hypothetical protein [Pirellulaceae bacterium]
MASRGWQHDEAAAVVEEETIKLTFKHERANVKVELRQGSKEVRVSLDCENLQFTGTQATEKVELAAGTVWGIIALPGGGCLPVQLY